MTTPAFALDFTSATLNPSVTFTRSGATATRVNASGYIETVAADTARFDFDPVTLVCKGLLVEETRANLQRYSTINNANWNTLRANIIDNQIVSPLGTTTAPKVECNTTGGGMNVNGLQCTIGSGATITASVCLKKGYDNFALLIVADATTSNGVRQWININTGVLGSTSTFGSGWAKVGATVSNAGNGWYRVTFTVSTTGTTAGFFIFPSCPADGDASCTAGVTFGYPWGAQVEEGLFATSYIPTGASAVTRNADVATITGASFSSFWQAGAGGAQVQVTPSTVSGVRPLIQFDDGTANEIIALRGNTTNPELYIVDGGVLQAQIDAGTIAVNVAYNLFGVWNTNDCAAKLNNGAKVTDTSATIPTATQARIGSDGTNYLNGHLASINYYTGNQIAGIGRYIYTRRKNKVIQPAIF